MNIFYEKRAREKMQLLEIQNIGLAEGWSAPAIFWTIAIIASLLLVIFLVYSLFSEENESDQSNQQSKLIQLEARTVLLFFTAFGWAATIASYFPNLLQQSLLYGTIAGLFAALSASVWGRWASKSRAKGASSTSMGKVSQSIPPHRAGIGKVYMKSNRMPVELDAITIGKELPVGSSVRIVTMLDDHTAVVEPLESRPGGFEQ